MDASAALVSEETTAALGLPPASDPPGEGGRKRQESGGNGKRGYRKKGGRGEKICIGSINVNGLNEERKRREVVEEFNESGLDVLGVQETHLLGKGEGGQRGVWKGMKGWTCWSGMSEEYKGRKKMGVAVLLSERMNECVIEYENVSARMCWVLCKIGIRKIGFVSAYAPVNETSARGRKEMEDF